MLKILIQSFRKNPEKYFKRWRDIIGTDDFEGLN